ncbi:hypothetical protein ACQEVF_58030 [Nonomuraea polychroma]|uniref:hypothetical protein n=1 Tax=Nonomuraea polychroma TaxID=46176 RepID=UPI003D8EF332
MVSDVEQVNRTPYKGYLTLENIHAVASRLQMMLHRRRYTLVRTSQDISAGRPAVYLSCVTQHVEVETDENGPKAWLSWPYGDHGCLLFTEAADQEAAAKASVWRTDIEFTRGQFAATSIAGNGNVSHCLIVMEDER